MAFPELGKWLSVTLSTGDRVTGRFIALNLKTRSVCLQGRDGVERWVPVELVQAKYGK